MPDVRERPESVRKMKWKPGPKVRPGGAAARAWNRPWRCPWRTLLQTPGYRRFNRRRSGLDEFSHVLKLLKHGFAIDIQNLSQFVYAWFRH